LVGSKSVGGVGDCGGGRVGSDPRACLGLIVGGILKVDGLGTRIGMLLVGNVG
jgi:hypothetical protein